MQAQIWGKNSVRRVEVSTMVGKWVDFAIGQTHGRSVAIRAFFETSRWLFLIDD